MRKRLASVSVTCVAAVVLLAFATRRPGVNARHDGDVLSLLQIPRPSSISPQSHVLGIYTSDGVMKSSLALTFRDITTGVPFEDQIKRIETIR